MMGFIGSVSIWLLLLSTFIDFGALPLTIGILGFNTELEVDDSADLLLAKTILACRLSYSLTR